MKAPKATGHAIQYCTYVRLKPMIGQLICSPISKATILHNQYIAVARQALQQVTHCLGPRIAFLKALKDLVR